MSKSEERAEEDERTTSYVIEELGNDFDKVFSRLNKKFDEEPDSDGLRSYDVSDARDLFRTLFAYLEGTSFAVRMWSAKILLDEGTMDGYERAVVSEQAASLREGEVILTPLKISLQENIRFTFKLADRAHKSVVPALDTSKAWWSDFKKAVKVRDRLMHPKLPEDLDVSGDDLLVAVKVFTGFGELLGSYGASRTPAAPTDPTVAG